jgi:formylglycine-generating enzyme required for sulfatase activity
MTKFLLFQALLLLSLPMAGQDIHHVDQRINGDRMVITYRLSAERPSRVEVFYTLNGMDTTKVPVRFLEGDMGIYVKPGNDRRIIWQLNTIDSTLRDRIDVHLEAGAFVEMVKIKGGTFQMGCTREQNKCDGDERPVHRITLSDYSISRFEITNRQYCVFLNENDIDRDGREGRTALIHIDNSHCQIKYRNGKFVAREGRAHHPVVEVTWNGAQAFCQWAEGRLPTEAEWEYAARGGHKSTQTRYSGSNHVDTVAWYDSNSNGQAHPVGAKKPNELGIYDMSGNVWEWCFDWYGDYPKENRKNPKGPKRGQSVVVRGGSWLYYGSFCRVANRGSSAPEYAFNNYGFRLVRKLQE